MKTRSSKTLKQRRIQPSLVRLDDRLFQRLHAVCGVDFSQYKTGTMQRRLARRMAVHGLDFAAYLELLEQDSNEVSALFRELLIHVTEFFRDPPVFQILRQSIFPQLLENLAPQSTLRLWIPGCANGAEVYSLAICLLEALADHPAPPQLQLFGTDLSSKAITAARAGCYSEAYLSQVSYDRLQRFFVKMGHQYQVIRALREHCVFAQHNLITHPPFSRIDFISCRNLLIYLDSSLQKQVIPLLNYALKPGGLLLLGASETIGLYSDVFSPVDKRLRLYAKTLWSDQTIPKFAQETFMLSVPSNTYLPTTRNTLPDMERLQQQAEQLLKTRYIPPSVLCDDELNVLEFRGDTALYLVNPNGPPTHKLSRLLRPSLLVVLSDAIAEVRNTNLPTRREHLLLTHLPSTMACNFEITPLSLPPLNLRWFLIAFERITLPAPVALNFWERLGARWLYRTQTATRALQSEQQQRIAQLTQDLEASQAYMRTLVENHDTVVEELKAAEEELLSSNEEFQSTNEELVTAQEELQSTNDELWARNRDLNQVNDELRRTRDFAEAVLETMRYPLLVLNDKFIVQRANRAFYQTFKTTRELTESRLLYQLGAGHWDIPSLRQLLEEVLPKNTIFQNQDIIHSFPEIGLRTMRLNARTLHYNSHSLILLAIEDITEYQSILQSLQQADRHKDEFLAMLAHELRNPLGSIRNALEIWRRSDASPKIIARAQAMLERQLRQETRLLEDLLDLSRLQRNMITLQPETLDLGLVIKQVVEDLRHLSAAHHQSLTLELPELPLIIHGDVVRLRQVITNLLHNAIKYTPNSGFIELQLTQQDAFFALLTITDTGSGIDPELLPHIFNLFVQADHSLSRTKGGLGIGLTLVQRLVTLHGGRVEAQSAGIGAGSKFSVWLPITSNAAMPLIAPAAVVHTPRGPVVPQRILVVDDNVDVADSTELWLQLEGHVVETAHDGPSALTLAQQFQPQIVLLDIGLPGMDGYEVARRLRAMPNGADLLLVAASGYGQMANKQRAQAVGFDAYRVKPLNIKELQELIATHAQRLTSKLLESVG